MTSPIMAIFVQNYKIIYGGYGEMAQKVIEGRQRHVTDFAFEIEMAQNSNHSFFLYFLLEIWITCLFAEVAHFF